MLTATELANMRAAQIAALPGTCTISAKTETSDGMGGRTESWSTVASGVACRLSPMQAMGADVEAVVMEHFQGRSLWQLTIPVTQAISHNNRVTVAGTTYEVVQVRDGGQWETARRVILARVD